MQLPFIPDECKPENISRFIRFNFRGTISFVGKDLVEMVPYMNALANGPIANSPRDENGYLMIDEQPNLFYCVLDRYRDWLESDQPDSFDTHINSRGLCVSLARRMAFEPEYVKALSRKTVKTIDKNDLYVCYYCDKIFARNESSSMKECKYHKIRCDCNLERSYSSCCRLPYHSEEKLDIATPPKHRF